MGSVRGPAAGISVPCAAVATVLYGVVASSLEPFLAQAERADRIVPRFVQRELRRGFCPSCGGRRMADTAAHLVDRVLPRVPVRQWVLTLPFCLRFRPGDVSNSWTRDAER